MKNRGRPKGVKNKIPSWKKNIEQKDKELAFLCYRLNKLYEEIEPLRKEQQTLMYYYRNLLNRGHITREEYDKRSEMFVYKWKK